MYLKLKKNIYVSNTIIISFIRLRKKFVSLLKKQAEETSNIRIQIENTIYKISNNKKLHLKKMTLSGSKKIINNIGIP